MLLLHFLHFNVFVLLVWLSKVEKGGKGESFFSATTHTHQPTQKLDWKQRKTIRHTKLETFREKACHSRHFICILDPKKKF